jgi:predicted DNA-binding transcriptional regulator AlpA
MTEKHEQSHDRLITLQEAASRLNCSRTWIRTHAARLPFVRKMSPKMLRVSERSLNQYLDSLAQR